MVEKVWQESFFAKTLSGLWAWFCKSAGESICFSTLAGSRVVAWMCRRLPLVTAVLTGLLFVVPHRSFNNLYSLIVMLFLTGLLLIATVTGLAPGFAFHRMGGYALLFGLCVAWNFVFSLSAALSLRFFLFYVTAFIALTLTRSVLRTRRDLILFVMILLLAVTISGLYGLYQSYAGIEVNLSQVDLALNAGMPGRVYSFFDNPNNFAEILALTLPFFAALFFMAKSRVQKYAVILFAVPPVLSLVLTYTRAAWMAFAAAIVIFFYFTYRWVVPLIFIVGLAAFPMLPISIRERVLSIFAGTDSSILYRATIREQYFPLIREHWGIGMGLGTDVVKHTVVQYYEKRPQLGVLWWHVAPHTHNLYLQVWAEQGIIGAAAFCGACIVFVRQGVSSLFRSVRKNFLAAAGFAGITGSLIIGFGEYVWFYPRVMLIFWLVAGLTLTSLRLGEEAPAGS